ncbi:hypothetical protein BAUCODRAFT_33798 [Baudoinia panamericana UAMH 10762]|uniref:Uncharacterized protein n=1 Tax=Baudoinia panamericana (strain UAMH 10762) TaxID=717646 RepID=M2MXZ4_BAUPA|nr:uncharacterized protein BAUCODRAFT_33798 [Baudoinia panamericana UAMH 10762]EMC96443.1 hypothetical protein BAUCODRAFT_33798 [Baudoinia panamericana UAMH 10762]
MPPLPPRRIAGERPYYKLSLSLRTVIELLQHPVEPKFLPAELEFLPTNHEFFKLQFDAGLFA